MTRYADVLCDWLVELGYTDCYFVAGGNIMHLLNAARSRFTCVPFVHEVAAGVAAEYFNEAQDGRRAFALVTAGPGLTNIVTAVAGAYLESRELLVIGGQVKSTDIADGEIRQRGIQEIDGASIVRPIAVESVRLDRAIDREQFAELVNKGRGGRPGPVFIEICLDVQGAPAAAAGAATHMSDRKRKLLLASEPQIEAMRALLHGAERPVLLIGGGVSRATARAMLPKLRTLGIPLMTTWNAADRVGAEEPMYFGRPNTWGQRYANVLIQQADVIVALGTRLGLQQTGFNWREFGKLAKIVQVDIDRAELEKGHPHVAMPIHADANDALVRLTDAPSSSYERWMEFCRHVKARLPLAEPANVVGDGYIDPYSFFAELSKLTEPSNIVIPCSSGGANSVAMQALEQRDGQISSQTRGSLRWVTDSQARSRGPGDRPPHGSHRRRRRLHSKSPGLATAAVNRLNLKIFIFSNEGYASIRTTQRNYFGGAYVGCDVKTGLGFPQWGKLFEAFDIPMTDLRAGDLESQAFRDAFASDGLAAFVVHVDPEQTYFPKISSRITASGSMGSNPLHLMTPDLSPEVAADVLRYLAEPVLQS